MLLGSHIGPNLQNVGRGRKGSMLLFGFNTQCHEYKYPDSGVLGVFSPRIIDVSPSVLHTYHPRSPPGGVPDHASPLNPRPCGGGHGSMAPAYLLLSCHVILISTRILVILKLIYMVRSTYRFNVFIYIKLHFGIVKITKILRISMHIVPNPIKRRQP